MYTDSRSTQGIITRGANVYKGGTNNAQSGPLKTPPIPWMSNSIQYKFPNEIVRRRLLQLQGNGS